MNIYYLYKDKQTGNYNDIPVASYNPMTKEWGYKKPLGYHYNFLFVYLYTDNKYS